MKRKPSKLKAVFCTGQESLKILHGTPAEFAAACYQLCPEFISMDEAAAAVEKYNKEWAAAAKI